jgi:hypothetical protein
MKIVGFNFLKIHGEKTTQNLIQNFKINTNIDIADINEVKSDIFNSNESLLGIKFQYNIFYEPQIANISLAGMILISLPSKDSKELIKQWKNKQIPDEFKLPIFNIILKKSNLRAIQIEDELGLPTHITMPTLKPSSSNVNSN